MNHTLIAAIALALSAFTAVGQGFYVESKASTGDRIERFWYRPQMFRSTEEEGKVTVIRLDKEIIYSIDAGEKSYTEMSFSEMKGMREKAAALGKKRMENMSPEQKQKMEEMMKKMPPDKRKSMEGRMGGTQEPSDNGKYEVLKTGETKSISGFTCAKFIVKRHGGETETVWATSDIGPGMESLRQDMERFLRTVSTSMGTGKVGTEWYKEIGGFPIQTESHGSTRTVTKLEQRSINASEFEVPQGYTKKKMKGFGDPD